MHPVERQWPFLLIVTDSTFLLWISFLYLQRNILLAQLHVQTDHVAAVFFVAAVLHGIGSIVLAEKPKERRAVRRIGIAVFFCLFAAGLIDDGGASLAVTRIIQSLLIAWCVTGVLSILLPTILVIYSAVVVLPLNTVRKGYQATTNTVRQRRLAKALERKRILDAEEWERNRPERERQAKLKAEAAARQLAAQANAERSQQMDQQRRDAARFKCRLLFDRHYAEIKDSISRKRFQLYLDHELSDKHSADVVEMNAAQLTATIRDFFRKDNPEHDFPSVDALRDRFEQERQQIENSNLDEETKAAMLAKVNWEEDHAANRMNS